MRAVHTNFAIFALLAVICFVLADETQKTQEEQINNYEGRSLHSYENDTTAEIIEQLLQSRREGRNLDAQFNQVYADGHIDQALMQGNDMEARNIIREKLCGLGLMSCDYEEKRPLYSTIYAQEMPPPPPQHIRGGYPRPPPNFNSGPPPSFNAGPPPRIGYESSYKPSGPSNSFTGPSFEYTAPGQSFINSGPPTGEHIIYTKPPGPVYTGPSSGPPPYVFEKPGPPIKKFQTSSSSSSAQSGFYAQQSPDSFAAPSDVLLGNKADSAAGLQQHVHHHFHHLEGDAKVPAVTIPVTGTKAITTDFGTLAQSSSAFNIDQSSAFTAGFNGASHGSLLLQPGSISDFGNAAQKPNGELYKPTATLNSLNTYAGSNNELYHSSGSDFNAGPSNSFVQTGFNPTSGSYHSQNPDYYKKELHNFDAGLSSNSNFNAISSGYTGGSSSHKYNGIQDTARQQFVDCECVPVNQCPAADRIGRKEDLILPIDPRNLQKDIEALSDDQLAQNGTTTTTVAPEKATEDKMSKRAKREADNTASNQSEDEDVDIPIDAQGRQNFLNLPAVELLKRKVLPTYGISFGLPSHSAGYPSNVIGDYIPARNPYFGAVGPDGLNLGLLSVNPLVSVQVAKTEFGDKVVKPFVNLHVTPNSNIVKSIGDIFKRRPGESGVYNTHYHHHDHNHGAVHSFDEYQDFSHHDHYSHPYEILEMVHSTPIMEYHSTSNIPFFPTNYHTHIDNDIHVESAPAFFPTQHDESYVPHIAEYENYPPLHFDEPLDPYNDYHFARSSNITFEENDKTNTRVGKKLTFEKPLPTQAPGTAEGADYVTFPKDRRRRRSIPSTSKYSAPAEAEERAYYGRPQAAPGPKTCRVNEVCCRRPFRTPVPKPQFGRCGVRNAAGITGRIKNPVYVDGDAEFGEYPWHVAILKKDPHESIYACGGTLIDAEHVITAAHCIKSQNGFDLRARLGEWDVNHDVEFFPYIERDVVSVHVHPEYYAGTLDNDIAILKLDHPVDFTKNPHISPACLPDKFSDWTGARCWTTGWGKDAFGEHGKYQNILKEVDVPILSHHQCESQLQHTRLGYGYKLNPGFVCAGGEEGKDACKGDGGGPLVCERNGQWNAVGIVSWGIGCGQVNVPGVYVRVAHYLDWIHQITHYYKK